MNKMELNELTSLGVCRQTTVRDFSDQIIDQKSLIVFACGVCATIKLGQPALRLCRKIKI